MTEPAKKARPPRRSRRRTKSLLDRITSVPGIFGGKAIIRGHRLSVEAVLAMLEDGATVEELLAGYPFLEPDDIRACLAYARRLVSREPSEALQVRERS
ncbi:MAG TPA: DUF433 domain-containing protein [Planctomycetota bacterium]|nr:DUF433 domain-containing protein [Planctomycetota bacterium]